MRTVNALERGLNHVLVLILIHVAPNLIIQLEGSEVHNRFILIESECARWDATLYFPKGVSKVGFLQNLAFKQINLPNWFHGRIRDVLEHVSW